MGFLLSVTTESRADVPMLKANEQNPFSWDVTDDALALLKGGEVVWRFHAGAEETKPYFHPLTLPDGSVLTGERPDDHPWHLGAWYSWKYLNGKNFWEEDEKGRPLDGVSEVASVTFLPHDDFSAEIHLHVDYVTHAGMHLMREFRRIDLSSPNEKGGYRVDSQHRFVAQQDTVINRYYYGGYSLRMLKGARLDWHFMDAAGNSWTGGQTTIQPREDSPSLTGPASPWVTFVDNVEGRSMGAAIIDHPSNPRHPTHWLVIPDMPFFSPIIHWDSDLSLTSGEELTLGYSLVIWADRDATEFVEAAYAKLKED